MKLLHQIYYYLLLLSVVVVTVKCSLESDSKRDLNVCNRSCNIEFHSKLVNFIYNENRDNNLFGDLHPFWSTCQYRCFRCRIPGANAAMETMDWMFTHDRQSIPSSLAKLVSLVSQVEHSTKACVRVWEHLVTRRGDHATIIE